MFDETSPSTDKSDATGMNVFTPYADEEFERTSVRLVLLPYAEEYN
jgi:hypothetical protein